MSREKVTSFVSFLDGEIKSRWDERALLNSQGESEQAYYCKMRATQTESIKAVFMKLLNDDELASSEQDNIVKIFKNRYEKLD